MSRVSSRGIYVRCLFIRRSVCDVTSWPMVIKRSKSWPVRVGIASSNPSADSCFPIRPNIAGDDSLDDAIVQRRFIIPANEIL